MMIYRWLWLIYIGIIAIMAMPISATALTSEWHETPEGRIRLISSGYKDDHTLMAGIEIQLTQGWSTYWHHAGDSSAATRIEWHTQKNITSHHIDWPIPTRSIETFGTTNLQSFIYTDEVTLPLTLAIADPNQASHLALTVHYAVCNTICLLHKADLTLTIPAHYHNATLQQSLDHYRTHSPQENGHQGLTIESLHIIEQQPEDTLKATIVAHYDGKWDEKIELFITGEDSWRFLAPNTTIEGKYAWIDVAIEPLLDQETFPLDTPLTIVLAHGDDAVNTTLTPSNEPLKRTISYTQTSTNIAHFSFTTILLFALLGGLILNIMPCVLPVLSLKILGIISHGGQVTHYARASLLSAACGIIASFTLLALIVIALKAAGYTMGWGVQFQHPLFLTFLIVVITVFSVSLWGKFDIQLPAFMGRIINRLPMEKQDHIFEHFLTGMVATLLATPCSAPFLGTAVSFALAGEMVDIISVFVVMGIGMALPYLILSLFPRLVILLPKPGKWMLYTKQVLALLLWFTIFWLLWVMSNQTTGIYLFAITCSIIIITLLLLLRTRRWLWIIIAIIAALMTAWFAPQHHNKNRTNDTLPWQAFEPEKIPSYVAAGKRVFVDITADWCVTCKSNKFLVLERPKMIQQLSHPDIILMQGDWTRYDPVIFAFLKKHQRHGIPFNLVYGSEATDGIILPEILTKDAVLDALQRAHSSSSIP